MAVEMMPSPIEAQRLRMPKIWRALPPDVSSELVAVHKRLEESILSVRAECFSFAICVHALCSERYRTTVCGR
jgi:hypothetical protein